MNNTIKTIIIAAITIAALFFISKCNKVSHTVPQDKPTNTTTVITTIKDSIIRIPIYIPGKTEYIKLFSTITITKDSLVKDTTLNTYTTLGSYSQGFTKDSIITKGTLLGHYQTLTTYPKKDTIIYVDKIVTTTVRDSFFITKEKLITPKPKRQLYVGATLGITNLSLSNPVDGTYTFQPSLSLKTKKGHFYTLSKDLFCKTCGSINIALPIKIKSNE